MDHIHQIIRERYSTVVFSSKHIEEAKLTMLLEAARWAPSAFNEQPWRFIVGVKGMDDNYQKILDCLVEANQYWAKYAPVLIISVAHKYSSVTGKSNRFAHYDTGMAVGNLLAQATSLGLYVHQMGGYNTSKAKELFEIENDYELMAAMAIGYKGEIDLFPDDLKERESKKRYRRSIDEILM
jgi:nitroreductase